MDATEMATGTGYQGGNALRTHASAIGISEAHWRPTGSVSRPAAKDWGTHPLNRAGWAAI